MANIKNWLKNWNAAAVVIVACIVVALILFFTFGALGGFAGTDVPAWVSYYRHELTGSLSGFIYLTILFLCLVIIMFVIWSLGAALLEVVYPKLRIGKRRKEAADTPRDLFFIAVRQSGEVFLIAPAIFFLTLVALAMGEANAFAISRLQDVLVIGWEHALFSGYVFAALGAIHYPHWLIVFIIFSFQNMALILIGSGIILAYVARERFRELLVAFCIGILSMVPIWLAVPVLSPQDRFIDNIYQLQTPSEIAQAVAEYHPQSEIADFLKSIRAGKADLPTLPTTTFPSAHVFWAMIAGYYLFRAGYGRSGHWVRWLGWIALPFLLASTFGTVLLAQHYFMDIPASLAIAALAIFFADRGKSDVPRGAAYR